MEWTQTNPKSQEEFLCQSKKGTMPPRYDEAFKAGAVKMVTEQGRPSKEVATELGISYCSFKLTRYTSNSCHINTRNTE